MKRAVTVGVATLAGSAAAMLITASGANAAGLQEQPLTCDNGQEIVVLTNNNNSSDMGGWEAVQVVSGGSGRLIPTQFEFSAFDITTNTPIFDGTQLKGSGNANHRQATVTCSDTQTATLGDLLEPGDEVPPGAQLSDEVSFTISATVVWIR